MFPVLNSRFIMLPVSLRNLLVRDVFKVVPLELAVSSFLVFFYHWVVLIEWDTSSNIPLGTKVQGCNTLLYIRA